MKHDRATEGIRELAALHALGALTQHEARGLEIHLAEGCDVCASEFRRFSEAAAALGLAVEEHPVPEYLKDILLARVEREPQAAGPRSRPGTESLKDPERKFDPSLGARAPAGRSRGRTLPWLVAAACAALAIGATLAWKSARGETERLRTELAETLQRAGEARNGLRALESKSDELDKILEMAGTQGVQSARLVGQPATPANSGILFWDARRRQCLVIASLLPAPEGQVYQLWFSSSDAKVPVGVLKAGADGRILTQLRTPEGLERALSAIITLESAPGSASPEGPFCATGRIE